MSGYKILSIAGNDPALEPYKSMVFSDFLESLRHLNDLFSLTEQESYYATYHRVIEALLAAPSATVRLAVLADDADTCLGWCLHQDETLHYVYVKKAFRGKGIGRQLLPANINRITHLTRPGERIWKAKFPLVPFNPFF